MKKYLFIILAIFITSCVNQSYVEINGQKINVEIAKTQAEREKGLMLRDELCDDCGMLFIFKREDYYGFWMKNTLIPLDMVFIDSDFNIIDIKHAKPCTTENCEIYTPKEKSMYVLETNVDKFDETIIGEKVEINAYK
jgi:uncharacterized membrane protein (UPF0127 family)